jgi:threonine/homoserine/homoserine lactone efflux protein
MNWGLLAGFLLAALVIQVTPGPGMLFVLANGITGGARAGTAAACGAASAMIVHTTVVALGLAALFRAAPTALEALRIGGALYLGWLALRAFRSPPLTPDSSQDREMIRFWTVFIRGAINNLLNPKIILFYLVFLPQFVDTRTGHVPAQLFTLGLALLLVGLVVDLSIGVISGHIRGLLQRQRVVARLINKVAGTIYGGLAVRLVANR